MKNKFTFIYDKLIQEQTQFVKKQFLHKLISEQTTQTNQTTNTKQTASATQQKETKVVIPEQFQKFKDKFVELGTEYKSYTKQKLEKAFDDQFKKKFILAYMTQNDNIVLKRFKYLRVKQNPDGYYKHITDSWNNYKKGFSKEQRIKELIDVMKSYPYKIEDIRYKVAINWPKKQWDSLYLYPTTALYDCNGEKFDNQLTEMSQPLKLNAFNTIKQLKKYIINNTVNGKKAYIHPAVYAQLLYSIMTNEQWEDIDKENKKYVSDLLKEMINTAVKVAEDYKDLFNKAHLEISNFNNWKTRVTGLANINMN